MCWTVGYINNNLYRNGLLLVLVFQKDNNRRAEDKNKSGKATNHSCKRDKTEKRIQETHVTGL